MGLKTIKDRWKAETPAFFKEVRKFSLAIGSSCTAVWMINSSMGLELPVIILSICKYSIAICASMGLTAQLTKV